MAPSHGVTEDISAAARLVFRRLRRRFHGLPHSLVGSFRRFASALSNFSGNVPRAMSDLPRYITGRVTNGSTRFFNVGTSRGKTGKKQQHGAALHAPIQHSSSEPRDHRPIQVYHVSQSLGRKPREPVVVQFEFARISKRRRLPRMRARNDNKIADLSSRTKREILP
jgi:hypothetical protein